ncbi:4'-phosphopantetheinyl transferase family protein [Gelidibacter sp.]|uniref:4'-phosphopantetheinyl transferase family protein n=1 Tax=Gelidibacter sp. TaxID=2018083 RepID=UPI002C01E5EA|nr:4'-phosphopantetheinyl transferase superfamily protein [Gelidibacter sp.]HUH29218.1 4'-phosphopantetheinyl transferase superfamily protein [Gelidibacter sp.]
MYSTILCRTIECLTRDPSQNRKGDPGVTIYKIELLKLQETIPDLTRFLSDSECQRANRYHFIKDKNRFIICRALLKLLLAEYTALDISQISIEVDAHKKPYLPSHPSVYFNVSHSLDYAIIAIAENPVGVDLEYINKEFNYKEILPNVYHQKEMDEIEISKDKYLTFYKLWTRKEAVVKAIGKGIDNDLYKISVIDGSHTIPSSLVCNQKNLYVFSFMVNHNYIGALALTVPINNLDDILFQPLPR